ncbi:hypothetical protein [Senimuribacter intestinalis]|nr:hypothetical protein [Senimuribacter intestinalis]
MYIEIIEKGTVSSVDSLFAVKVVLERKRIQVKCWDLVCGSSCCGETGAP